MKYVSLCEFMMSLFDNGDPDQFLFFVHNFNMNIAASGTLKMGAKVEYLRTLVYGKALRHFELLYSDVESTELLAVECIIKGLSLYFLPVNSLLKTKACNAPHNE